MFETVGVMKESRMITTMKGSRMAITLKGSKILTTMKGWGESYEHVVVVSKCHVSNSEELRICCSGGNRCKVTVMREWVH